MDFFFLLKINKNNKKYICVNLFVARATMTNIFKNKKKSFNQIYSKKKVLKKNVIIIMWWYQKRSKLFKINHPYMG